MDFSPFRKESNKTPNQFKYSMVCCPWVSEIQDSKCKAACPAMEPWCCSLAPGQGPAPAWVCTQSCSKSFSPRQLKLYIQDSEVLISNTVILPICSFFHWSLFSMTTQFILNSSVMQGGLQGRCSSMCWLGHVPCCQHRKKQVPWLNSRETSLSVAGKTYLPQLLSNKRSR